jgi:hypothetical protein
MPAQLSIPRKGVCEHQDETDYLERQVAALHAAMGGGSA